MPALAADDFAREVDALREEHAGVEIGTLLQRAVLPRDEHATDASALTPHRFARVGDLSRRAAKQDVLRRPDARAELVEKMTELARGIVLPPLAVTADACDLPVRHELAPRGLAPRRIAVRRGASLYYGSRRGRAI